MEPGAGHCRKELGIVGDAIVLPQAESMEIEVRARLQSHMSHRKMQARETNAA